MFILLGTNLSGKTFFIKKYIQKQKTSNCKSNKTTEDIKPYVFRNSYILDTPNIEKYKNIKLLIEKCIKITSTKYVDDIYVAYFINNYEDIKFTIKILNAIKEITNNIVLLDKFGVWNIKNFDIQVVNNEESLFRFINTHTQSNKINNTDKSIMVLGITNVGKTSILNNIVNDNVFRVSTVKNTTNELTFINFNLDENTSVKIYDTFGLENSTKCRIAGISNLLKYIDRVVLVMDSTTYYQKAYQYIFNFLNRKLVNITFMINKSDLITNTDKINILNFLSEKYKINKSDVLFNKTIGNSNTIVNFKKILNLEKPKLNHHLINKHIKKHFPNILYINESHEKNKIYKINIYMKRKIDLGLNISVMIKKLRNAIYKLIKNRNFAISFKVSRLLEKNNHKVSREYKGKNTEFTQTN